MTSSPVRRTQVEYDPAGCRHPEPRAARYRSYLRDTITVGEPVSVTIPEFGSVREAGGPEHIIPVEISGRPYVPDQQDILVSGFACRASPEIRKEIRLPSRSRCK